MNVTAFATKASWKRWLFLLLVLAALYVLLPQLGVFHQSWRILGRAEWSKLFLAIIFTALTYLAAAANYCLLAFKRLRYGRTVLAQVASMFANRLLPAGVGGIGVNYAYLRKAKHTFAQAASVVAANNLFGFIGHLLLLGSLLLLRHRQLTALQLPSHFAITWLDALVVILLAGALFVGQRWRRRLLAGTQGVLKQLVAYRRRPFRLGAVLLASVSLTLCNVASLYYCLAALGVQVSFVAVVLVFTLGIGVGTITPTPGGLGGVEAGLVAGLVAYHVSGAEALAAVLLYRFVSYWLALLVGAGAFVVAERRQYF